jgi:hypothetical protein
MSPDQSVRNLAILRLAVGIGAWLFPNLAGKLFASRRTATRRLRTSRGCSACATSRWRSARRRPRASAARVAAPGVMCDAADTAAAALGQRGGYLSTRRR